MSKSLALNLLMLVVGIALHAQNLPLMYTSQKTVDTSIDLNKPSDAFPSEPVQQLNKNKKVSNIQLYNELKHWSIPIEQPYHTLMPVFYFQYSDSLIRYSNVPVKVFLPYNFDPKKKYRAILYLHGATKAGTFDSDAILKDSGDFFVDYFRKNDFIIIKPYADQSKKFCWNPNPFFLKTNITYKVIELMIAALKKKFILDDDAVYALGHSDGGDGVFCLDIYNPSLFSGFYAYNTMTTQLLSNDVHPGNMVNKPFYWIHSDLDDLRPIERANQVAELLKTLHVNLYYKVYNGYKHFDKHLELDLPNALHNIEATVRNPFPDTIIWESNAPFYNGAINWLIIDEISHNDSAASWHQSYNVNYSFNGKEYNYYESEPGGKVVARYSNNTFVLKTSKVKRLSILIIPEMVDFSRPVNVTVNGKTTSHKVAIDREFMVNNFIRNFDKKAIWCNRISIDVN